MCIYIYTLPSPHVAYLKAALSLKRTFSPALAYKLKKIHERGLWALGTLQRAGIIGHQGQVHTGAP